MFSLSHWLVSLSIDHIVSSPVLSSDSSPSQGAGSFVLFDTALCCTCCIKSHHTPSVNCVYLSMNPYSRPQWLRSPKGRFCWMPKSETLSSPLLTGSVFARTWCPNGRRTVLVPRPAVSGNNFFSLHARFLFCHEYLGHFSQGEDCFVL